VTRTDVTIVEVGPRDGLQSVEQTMSTPMKCRWIDALAGAGLQQIQVGSFVSPRALPQMADCAAVVHHALAIHGLRVSVLAPNLRYAQVALDTGVHVLTIPVSVSAAWRSAVSTPSIPQTRSVSRARRKYDGCFHATTARRST
jgi:hydroxymethylglutaryl-CoA lyase